MSGLLSKVEQPPRLEELPASARHMMSLVAFLCGGPTRGRYALLTRLARYVVAAVFAAVCVRASGRLALRILRSASASPLVPSLLRRRILAPLSATLSPPLASAAAPLAAASVFDALSGTSSSADTVDLVPGQPAYYAQLKRLLAHTPLPACVVDLRAFDANASRLLSIARENHKRIRIATKSLRVPALIKRLKELGGDLICGAMCYSAQEAKFLASTCEISNLLVAYPTVLDADLAAAWELLNQGHQITLMVDCVEHVKVLEKFAFRHQLGDEDEMCFRVAIDVDVAWRPLGGLVHIGAQRSGVRSIRDFSRVLDAILSAKHLHFVGVMGYEAHIAGLPDQSPHSSWTNLAKQLLKRCSRSGVTAFREEIHSYLQQKNIPVEFFNGGGTGSIRTTVIEPWITEVAVGSGFLQSQLFDYYQSNSSVPAITFALQATRKPQHNVVVCQSGGFAVASGAMHPDKLPTICSPSHLHYTCMEGIGEVQTPLEGPDADSIHLGDPIFFRPAKAGEIAEHFLYYWIKDGDVLQKEPLPTYRGCGVAFY